MPKVTERQVVAILQELGKLWHDDDRLRVIQVLALRFGLLGGEPHSYERVAEVMAIAREEVREIENELLTRLAQAAELAGE